MAFLMMLGSMGLVCGIGLLISMLFSLDFYHVLIILSLVLIVDVHLFLHNLMSVLRTFNEEKK